MPFKTVCPSCAKNLQVPDTAEGNRVKCPACAHVWQIPRRLVAEVVSATPVASTRFDELMSDSLPSAAMPATTAAAPAAASRAGQPSGSIASSCTLHGATITLSFGPVEVIERLREKLEKRLGKKGITLYWTNESDSPEIAIRIVKIDEGSQLLRYILPFIAPAVLEVEGRVAIAGSSPRRFHYTQKAQLGLFGGSARGMLNVCADRVSGKIAKDVLKASRK
jgi:hypothetical protein